MRVRARVTGTGAAVTAGDAAVTGPGIVIAAPVTAPPAGILPAGVLAMAGAVAAVACAVPATGSATALSRLTRLTGAIAPVRAALLTAVPGGCLRPRPRLGLRPRLRFRQCLRLADRDILSRAGRKRTTMRQAGIPGPAARSGTG